MKRTLNMILSVLFVMSSGEKILCQIASGDKELSISASFMSREAESDNQAWTSFIFPVRVGFFVTDNIEIEPEILFSKFKNSDAGYIISGNIAYHFLPGNEKNNGVPFVFAGFGFANTIPFFPNIAYVGDSDETRTTLNAGAGLKVFISKPAAVRVEYRFQKFMNGENIYYHNVLVGISVFI